jgi:hypothetical protein
LLGAVACGGELQILRKPLDDISFYMDHI